MKIALGADHGGFALKQEIADFLTKRGYKTLDYGTKSADSCDYPIFAFKVANAVCEKKADFGILICKSGNGMAIMANKLPNVRAAICFDKNVAVLSRQHNDANILVLGSEHILDEPDVVVEAWLAAKFEGGRHKRRVDQISRLEKKVCEAKGKRKAAKKK